MADAFDPVPRQALGRKWGWFVALGALLLMCSLAAFANLFAATVVSVYYVGMLMLVGGLVHLAHAFQVRGWDHVLFWALSGVLYALAGIFAFANPLLASAALTLMLAVVLVVAGVLRVWIGRRLKPADGWLWILLGGCGTALAGFIVALG